MKNPLPRRASDEIPIMLRAYVRSSHEKRTTRVVRGAAEPPQPSELTLVFDTETTIYASQEMRIGFCWIYRRDALIRRILFYDPNVLKPVESNLAKRYGQQTNCEVCTRDEFVESVFYKYGYFFSALIVGFNLPFDLSRIAFSQAPARGVMRGGFSLKLSGHKFRPPIQIKHYSKFYSKMRFAAPFVSRTNRSQRKHGRTVPPRRGFFLDVRTFAAALFSRSFSLAKLSEFLCIDHGKLDTERHGKPLTWEYLEYANRDVLATWECYRELVRRYELFGLRATPPHRIYSEASIGKAYFQAMGIQSWFKVQGKVPSKLLAQILSAYFGGRSEVRIRREMRQVVLTDFVSMYPTACTLMRLWPFITGVGMRWRDGTAEVRRILETWTLEDLKDRSNWPKLIALVQAKPDIDIFPVRAQYGDGPDGTIGVNKLSSDKSLWFTLAECLASKLLAGKPVEISRAIIFTPGPPQPDLKPVAISGNSEYSVDPYKDDFFKRLIELRQTVKRQRDEATGGAYQRLDIEQGALKIAANATSYGIYIEINVKDLAEEGPFRVHTAVTPDFTVLTDKQEQPGRYFHPLLATAITGAARLMLAIAERLVFDHGLEWAFCDTDSMAIAKPADMDEHEFVSKVDRIVSWFESLNPYEFKGSILKIEDVNYSLENSKCRKPLFVWAVSAKRYALFNLDHNQPIIRKASGHGSGYLHAPYDQSNPARGIPKPRGELTKIGVELWQHDLWWVIVKAAIDGHPDIVDLNYHPALKKPAASRYAATTPGYLRWFDLYNEGLPFRKQVKPFGFVCAFKSIPSIATRIGFGEKSQRLKRTEMPRPVGPFDKSPIKSAKQAFDRNTKRPVPIAELQTYQQTLAQFHLHPELKFHNGDYLDRGMTERRYVRVSGIEYIGKESNKWEDQYYFGFDPDEEIHYGMVPIDKKAFVKALISITNRLGQREMSEKLDISRTLLTQLIRGEFAGYSASFLKRLYRIVSELNSEHDNYQNRKSELIGFARTEIGKIGLIEFARRLGADASNVTKVIKQRRELGKLLLDKLEHYFRK